MMAKPEGRAAVSLVEKGGKLLAVWNKRLNGWTLPGGKVEDGESLHHAQARELAEETGLHTVDRELVYVGTHEAIGTVWLVHIYRVDPVGDERGVEEGCPVKWMTREEYLVSSPFAGFYREVFAAIPSR